ncbi:MAG: extracellular solute-binding protein [Clostridia bacterium]|nr:extracellular solute-binding protein [Clostridia bacterium]
MKNYLIKLLCLVLCLALLLSFTACNKSKTSSFNLGDDEVDNIDDEDNTNTDNGSTDASTVDISDDAGTASNTNTPAPVANADSLSWNDLVAKMPASLRGSTFTVLSWNPVTDVTDADKVVKKFESQTGITVKWTQESYDTYETKIAALINAKKSPDLIRFITPAPARMYLCQDLKTATGFDFKGDIWDSRATSSYSYNGKIYAAAMKNSLNQQPTAVLYRPSIIKRYKLDDPYTLWKSGQWTYDKFKEICRDFKEATDRPAWMTSGWLDYLWLNDIDLITFDGSKYKNNLSDPRVVTGLQEIIGCRGEICPEAMGTGSLIENGTYLFYTDNILACRTTDFHFTEIKAKNDLEAVPFPTQPGKTYYTNFQEFEAYGVPKGASNGAAAYYFLRCYLNAENYNEKTFFCSTQVLETYKYLMSQKNYNFNVDRRITDAAGTQNGGLHTMIRTGEITQASVKSKLDSLSPFFDKAAKQANETLAKFK